MHPLTGFIKDHTMCFLYTMIVLTNGLLPLLIFLRQNWPIFLSLRHTHIATEERTYIEYSIVSEIQDCIKNETETKN